MDGTNIKINSLYELFMGLPDHRDPRGKRYPLADILMIIVSGILCKEKSCTGIALFAHENKKFFNSLGIKAIPSHDTLSATLRNLDHFSLNKVLIKWINSFKKEVNDHIILDGKSVNAAALYVEDQRPQYILNAFSTKLSSFISQLRIDEKKNEISTIPLLLSQINLENNIVTIDAIGTQKRIMEQITKSNGDFVLPVKENQKDLLNDVSSYFDILDNKDDCDYEKTIEKAHGRIEVREGFVINLFTPFTNLEWPYIKAVGKIIRTSTRINYTGVNEASRQVVYYVMSKHINSKDFLTLVRNHWAIESRHNILDGEAFSEDKCTARRGNSMQNFSLFRKWCLNILTRMSIFDSKVTNPQRMTKIRENKRYLKNILFGNSY